MDSMDLKNSDAPIFLVIATRNRHKTAEFARMLGAGFVVSDLTKRPDIPEPTEDGASFVENARIKALAASKLLSELVLADDSGLEVDALGGAPGVQSARYAGPKAGDASNRAKLLAELDACGAKGRERSARFRCALVLAQKGEIVAESVGVVEGFIGTVERGAGGFGYDPLFIPDGFCQTFAELEADLKNHLSHRGRAVEELLALFFKH